LKNGQEGGSNSQNKEKEEWCTPGFGGRKEREGRRGGGGGMAVKDGVGGRRRERWGMRVNG